MRKLFKERKLFKGGNYMRKYGISFSFWMYIGTANWQYTLSELGHPCHFNKSKTDCAWCTPSKLRKYWFFFLIGTVFLFKTNLLTLNIGPFFHYMFFSDGFQCAPPGFDWLPKDKKGITYQNGQYCQRYNLNHKKCGGESKF